MKAQLIPYEYVNKDSSCPFTFFGSLLCSCEVSSTTFCIVEKTLNLLYPFSGVHLGIRPLESRRQV